MLSVKTESYEIYAPDQTNLNKAEEKVDLAYKRLSVVLGEKPPLVAFLLFPSNEDLLKFDYSDFKKRGIHFLPLLTDKGFSQLQLTHSNDDFQKGVSLKIEITSKRYDSLGVFLSNFESEDLYGIIVEEVLKQNSKFRKNDILMRVNSSNFNRLSEFDVYYSTLKTAEKIAFEVLRNHDNIIFTLPKPSILVNKSYDFNALDENPIAHEAGHMLFWAYVDFKINNKHFRLDPNDLSKPPLFYGHPLAPDWLDEAMAVFCESDESWRNRITSLQFNIDKMMALRTFIFSEHPSLSKENKYQISTSMYYGQAIAFAQYLFEKEGSKFIASLAIDLANGVDFEKSVINAKNIPQDIESIDADFRDWLKAY